VPKAASEEKPKPASKTSPILTATPGKASHPTAAAEPEARIKRQEGLCRRSSRAQTGDAGAQAPGRSQGQRKSCPAPKGARGQDRTPSRAAGQTHNEGDNQTGKRACPGTESIAGRSATCSQSICNKGHTAKPTVKSAEKAKPTVKAAPAKKTKATHKRTKPATPKELPAKLLDEIAAEENAPVAEPVEEAAPSEARSSRAKAGPATVSHRTAGKAKAAAAQERPNQLYLWMAAGRRTI